MGRTLLSHRSVVRSSSPDARHVAAVLSTSPLFGGLRYDIEVTRADGQAVSRMTLDDDLAGWPHEPSIEWTADSGTVVIGLRDGDADTGPPPVRKKISIDVR